MTPSTGQPIPFRSGVRMRLLVLAGAVAVGLVAQQLVVAHLVRIEELSRIDMLQARADLALVLEIASVAVFGMTGSVGVSLLITLRRSLALEQFPPPGMWSWGTARRTVTGRAARVYARFGMVLAIVLILASCAGGALTWYMASVLRACRAGVPMITA
jgi:hypothetical protein